MKTAIYLDNGETQLVLTPESRWEKNILGLLHEVFPQTFYGGFYACQGGWIRHYTIESENTSLIFRIPRQTDISEKP